MLREIFRSLTSVLALLSTKIPLSLMGEPEKSAQKYATYVPDPNDGSKRPFPVMRPVVASTEMLALSCRESERSVKSMRTNGLLVLFPYVGVVGNVKRKSEVCDAVVIATLTPLCRVRLKYPGVACSELLM